MKKHLIKFLALISIISTLPAKPLDSIDIAEIRAHIEFLASPELEGREVGSNGCAVTAKYIATRFKEFGLQSLPGAEDFYQRVTLSSMKTDYENSGITIVDDKGETRLLYSQDYYFFPKGGDDAGIVGELALCGYGITAPEYQYDDYAGFEVRDKIVVVFNGEPQENDSASVFNGTKKTKYSMVVVKARIAQEYGAKALMVVQTSRQIPTEIAVENYLKKAYKPIYQLPEKTGDFPVFYITQKGYDKIFSDIDLGIYLKQIDSDLQTGAFNLNKSAKIKIRFKEKTEVITHNVIGYLPGMDAKLSQEHLIIGAHYDHEGKSEEGIFLGADDNASGVAGLLELAQAFSQNPKKPKRSIVFIAFTAEEKGMLGSQYYTAHPLLSLDKAVAMINMDEIGRNGAGTLRGASAPDLETAGGNYLMVLYSAQAPLLEELNSKANREIGLNLDFDANVNFGGSVGSDQAYFHNAGIPALFYFTGFHPDYSRPSDSPDKINYPKLNRIVNLIYNVSEELLDSKTRPYFDHSIKSVAKKQRMTF
jgi:hypothetical protein